VDLIVLVLVCCLVGFLVYFLTTKIPMPSGWASAIQAIALVAIILFLLTRLIDIPNVLK